MKPHPSYYEEYIYLSRYSKWLEEEGRRETWEETVTRVIDYYKSAAHLPEEVAEMLWQGIYNLEVMPSMRAVMSAGPALDRCHVAAYNCAYLPVDSPRSFDEAMYILMSGTGVGYSVEEEYTHQLPKIPGKLKEVETTIVVEDSKQGWAGAFNQMLSLLYAGMIPRYDISKVREAGARLKTFGGRASGPEPLIDLFKYTIALFKKAAGRRLTTLECHDLMCKIASIVVVGGVRRSALISLSDVTDDRLRGAKSGEWWSLSPERGLANNSAVYENRRPEMDLFMKEWSSLYYSKSGERGFFSREACNNIVKSHGRRSTAHKFGTNPCSEIILRPFQFCNLTEIVVRPGDRLEDLKRKAELASILGTIQSLFTDFDYLRPVWRENTEEERLLGVSLTGVCDNKWLLDNLEQLEEVRDHVIAVNKEWATYFGIPQSAATTAVKPSGTVSQKVDSASGMHRRHAEYYIRAVRNDSKDPLTQMMKDVGFVWEQDVMNPSATVFYFPKKAPANHAEALRENSTAIDNLELWLKLQKHWCEHKPSATINVREEEWMDVGAWVYRNFDYLSGVSFLPYDGGTYRQAPYTECTKEEYEAMVARMPTDVDWGTLANYEFEDNTTGSQELACTAGGCEI